MVAAARAAARWEAWAENSAKAAPMAAAGQAVAARAVGAMAEVSSAELEGRPAGGAEKAATSAPHLVRMVASTALVDTVAVAEARRAACPRAPPIRSKRKGR